MPNRIIRDGILSSDRVDKIAEDPACEIFYRRLFSVVDDFGRFSGDNRIIRAALYPLRLDAVPESKICEYVTACEAAGLLVTYAVDGKPYLELLDFRQRLRRMVSKYPPRLTAANGQSPDGEVRPESEVESETEVEDETETCASDDAPVCDSSYFTGRESVRRPAREETSAEQSAWFEQWWSAYWLKKDRARAHDAFCRHVKTQELFDIVLAATKAQFPEMIEKLPMHRPYAAGWLENKRWQDLPAAAQPDVFDQALKFLDDQTQ
jgi:hypothetical protein